MSREGKTVEESSGPSTESTTINTGSPGHLNVTGPAVEAARDRTRGRWSRVIFLGVGMVASALFFWKGLPFIREYLSHAETNDAYVTGEPSAVGSRIAEVVKKVFVKNNDFVEQGTLLVTLDRAMLEVQADQKRAELGQEELRLEQLAKTLETNRASLDLARDKVAIAIASLIESSKSIEEKQLQVRYRVASLRAAAASLRSAHVDLVLAQKEFNRLDHLVAKQSATQAELDQKRSVLDSARERVKAAEQQVQQVRAQLALSPTYQQPDQIPDDLERTDTEVRKSVATGQQILAQLGIQFGRNLDPMVFKGLVTVTLARPQGWIDQISSVREAQGQVDQTLAALGGKSFDPSRLYQHPNIMKLRKELEQAELKLSYTEIRAPVTGVVNRKSVNPGDHVQASQALMSIQPLDSVYIVANFKENQLSDILIGQPVEIFVDAYPGPPLKGRVSGFAAATGAASSLLPAENATGNFVKVVQRLPVRIDLAEANPRKTPLLVGMSVIPLVDIKAMPTGPDAGERLRSPEAVRAAASVKEASATKEVMR
jgi:membrane fusion protein, multidrug efflux system